MEHSELFLLLPAYEEAEELPVYMKTIGIQDQDFYEKFILTLTKVIDFFCYEHYEGYYDSENVKAFMIPVNVMADCYPKILTLMRRNLLKWGSDWRRTKTISGEEQCRVLDGDVMNDTFSELSNRQLMHPENTYLLLDYDALLHFDKEMEIRFDGKLLSLACAKMEIVDMAEWFENNRKPSRCFHLNPKHGENGKGAHPEHKGDRVSLLLCSKDEAASLLNKAVGDKAYCKVLFYKDVVRGHYIEFKSEGNNIFHGFHIEGDDVSKRVSDEIKKKIEFVLNA